MAEITIELVDQATKQPIRGAMIDISGVKASTNERGEATFFVSGSGTLVLNARHLYYFPLTTTITIPPTHHKLSMLRARF